MSAKPLILYHIQNPAKAASFLALCHSLHFAVKPLSSADSAKTIGMLTGIPGTAAKTAKTPAGFSLPEVLIFNDFSSEALDFFLAAYRKTGIEPIPLKAVVTQHNISWPLHALVTELQKERAAMLMMQQNNKTNP